MAIAASKRVTARQRARIKKLKEKRKGFHDVFRAKNGYSWDWCLTFKVHTEVDRLNSRQEKFSFKVVLDRLADAGIETKLSYDSLRRHVFCKLRASQVRLGDEAQRIKFRMALDPNTVVQKLRQGKNERLENGDERVIWNPVHIPETGFVETQLDPYEYLYAAFSTRAEHKQLFRTHERGNPFGGTDRIKLIESILSSPVYDRGCGLQLQKCIYDEVLLGAFPLNDLVEQRSLENEVLTLWQLPWRLPVDKIREYLGEKIGFYFGWLSHYVTWLILPAIMGFLCWLDVAANDNNPNSKSAPVFAAFMAIWATLFLEAWKRKEKTYAMRWGMVGFESSQRTRAKFEGKPAPHPVTGEPYEYFPRQWQQLRIVQSSTVVLGLMLVVLGIIASIFVLKIVLANSKELILYGDFQAGSTIASVVNAVQITVLNSVYSGIAVKLTEFENHRTDSQFEDSLTLKTFSFQFLNSFSALFYIAFVKPFIQETDACVGDNCLAELQTALGTIFLVQLAVNNLVEVGVPAIQQYYAAKDAKEKEASLGIYPEDVSEVEHLLKLEEYHVLHGIFSDYAEMMIQFGYTTMFIAAFPLAAVMSFVNNYVEIRIDAVKILKLSRRPEPRGSEDVGTWFLILEVMGIIAVMTNAGIICYTGTFMENVRWVQRAWLFIIFSGIFLLLKLIIAIAIPDQPLDVSIQLKRNDFVVSKLIDDAQDEADDKTLDVDLDTLGHFEVRAVDDDPVY
jgi:anoctamin-10/anoctamin-7